MSTEFIVIILAGAAVGGFVSGLAGFGTALLSLGIWLQVLPTWQAVSVVAAMSIISGAQSLWLTRADIPAGLVHLPRFLLPALVGIPLGATALGWISASLLKFMIAGFMLLYGAFFALRRSLPQMESPPPLADMSIGFIGGVLGGAATLSGALPTMWFAMQPWSKGETSAVLRLYNVIIIVIAAMVFAWRGFYTRDTLVLVLIALPVTILSAQVGVAVFRRLSDRQFRWLLVWMLSLAGALLALGELF